MEYVGEPGTDAGGLTKELCTALLDDALKLALFAAIESMPSGAAVYLAEDAADGGDGAARDAQLEVIGWLLMRSILSTAGGLRSERLPPFRCPFTISRFVLRMLLAESIDAATADAAEHGEVDPQSARRVADGVRHPGDNVRAFEMVFRDGRLVTAANVHEWAVEFRTHAILGRRRSGIDALRRGFRSDPAATQLVRDLVGSSASVLQHMLCQPYLSPTEVAGLTHFRDFPAASPVPQWLRAMLLAMDQATLRKWLRWSTAAFSLVPVTVFLQPTPAAAAAGGAMPLPSAHTCFNTVDMYAYPSAEMLKEKLLMAIEETEMATR